MKEARQLETMQIPGQTGIAVSNDKWHSDLIDSWQTSKVEQVEDCIGQNFEQLQREKQLGLAQRLRQSLIQKKIADLSATYLTLSFAEIAEKTGLEKASLEEIITKMISEDIIKAKVSASTQTVEFIQGEDDSGSAVNSSQLGMIRTLEQQNKRIVDMMGKAAALDKQIKLSEQFIQVTVQKQSKH